MQTSVYIRLEGGPQGKVQWLRRSEHGEAKVACGELREAVLRSQGERVVVLLPAQSLLPLYASLPPLQGQKLRRALPYAVEEQLAEEVEGYHFAIGKRQDDGRVALLAVNREQMATWQRRMAEVELRPHRALDEAQCLPWQAGEWSLLLESGGALLRLSAHEAYSLPLDGLQPLLETALQQAQELPDALRVYDARGEEAESPVWQGGVGELTLHYEVISDPLALMVAGHDQAAINLLQGEFSRKEQLGKLWRPWRASAALLTAWLMLLGATSLWEYRHLAAEEQRLYAAVEQVYRDTFPEAKNVVNPKVQMERKLAELRGAGGGGAFVSLLAASGPLLKLTKGGELQNLRYRQGELELELQLADLPALDALKESLQQQGLDVEIRNASSRDNRVEGRLAIRRAGQ